ncbi:MAG TPA: response regulator transcription factor [Burkholderiaceae bacterium]|nr:response regulator transcription factor [Burkholderiaceae bacterium]
MRIGILDDDPVQLQLLAHVARAMGHGVNEYALGDALMRALARESYDMLILDWQLPDSTGIKVVEWVRRNVSERIPVLFVTSRDDERDIVEALTAGADDYMVKPVRVSELTARIRSLLRRGYPEAVGIQTFGAYQVNPENKTVALRGAALELTSREFDLAYFMFRNAGRLVSRCHLQEAVWRTKGDVQSRSLDTHMSRLRSKLLLRQENGYRLSSIYSQGYRLEANPTSVEEAGEPD